MTTRREYLSGLTPPLAGRTSRGRLSKAALAEVERARSNGMTFSDEKDSVGSVIQEPTEPSLPPLVRVKPNPVQRKISSVTGYTSEGAKVSSDLCFRCSSHVSRCACKSGIKASHITARWDKDSLQYGTPIAAK